MQSFIVTKAPVDLPDLPTVVGVFDGRAAAVAACAAPGTWYVTAVEPNKAYSDGQILDVMVIVIPDVRSFRSASDLMTAGHKIQRRP